MGPSARSTALSPTRPGFRWTAAGVCFLIGVTSLSATTATVVARVDAQLAAQFAVFEGPITAKAAQEGYAVKPSADADSAAVRQARTTIAGDPTAVGALEVLAFQASLAGDKARSDAIFAHIGRLTRRSFRSQMWAIEDAVNRGDIKGALRHYDLALRTSREAPATLYPTLASALAEPRIREELADIISKRPAWSGTFLAFLAGSSVAPLNSLAFFAELSRRGIEPDEAVKASLVDQLFEKRAFSEAFALYRTFRAGARATNSRDPRFELATPKPAVFDWTLGEISGLSVGIFPAPGGGLVDFALAPNVGATVIQQKQILPPGTYRLSGRMTGIEQPAATRPYWALICEDGRELGRVEIPNSSEQSSFAGMVVVPQGCMVQTLALVSPPSLGSSSVFGQVHLASLTAGEAQ